MLNDYAAISSHCCPLMVDEICDAASQPLPGWSFRKMALPARLTGLCLQCRQHLQRRANRETLKASMRGKPFRSRTVRSRQNKNRGGGSLLSTKVAEWTPTRKARFDELTEYERLFVSPRMKYLRPVCGANLTGCFAELANKFSDPKPSNS